MSEQKVGRIEFSHNSAGERSELTPVLAERKALLVDVAGLRRELNEAKARVAALTEENRILRLKLLEAIR